jgi:hypothetical protein
MQGCYSSGGEARDEFRCFLQVKEPSYGLQPGDLDVATFDSESQRWSFYSESQRWTFDSETDYF